MSRWIDGLMLEIEVTLADAIPSPLGRNWNLPREPTGSGYGPGARGKRTTLLAMDTR